MKQLVENAHVANEVTIRELIHRASQIRPVRTNPGSYRMPELETDMPLTGEFTD